MPVADGCTISSVVAPSWKFSDFSLERNNTANTDYITLLVKLNTAELSAFGGTEPMVITGGVPPTEAAMPGMGMGPMGGSPSGNSMAVAGASGSTTWYPCTFAEGVTPVAPFTCSFRYDAASSTLDMKSSWICSDLDENKPYVLEPLPPAWPFSLADFGQQDSIQRRVFHHGQIGNLRHSDRTDNVCDGNRR